MVTSKFFPSGIKGKEEVKCPLLFCGSGLWSLDRGSMSQLKTKVPGCDSGTREQAMVLGHGS